MSIERFFTTCVTIVEPGSASDGYPGGGTALDWENPRSARREMGWLTQVNTTEQIGGRDIMVTGFQLTLAACTSISPKARVLSDGVTYEVDGLPDSTPQTLSGRSHKVVQLRIAAEVTA